MKRIEWVDIIKGIGSIMVVASHAYKGFQYYYIIKTTFLICMPLYFFVSGYMYKRRENIKEHIKNKSYQLLIPYYSLLIFFLPISIFIFPSQTLLFYYDSIPIDLGRYFFARSNANPITGSLWFLVCLFFTQVVYNIMRLKLKDNVLNIVIFSMLILSYINSYYYMWFFLPMYFHLILASIPIYHIGHIYRESNVKDNSYILAIFAGVAIWGIMCVSDNAYNILGNYYGIPFITLFCSVVLTVVIKNISIQIDKFKPLANLFINMGKASIVIMAFHLTILNLLERVLKYDHPLVATLLSTFIPFGLYFVIKQFTITRALFMGKKEDTLRIKNKIVSIIKS